jgi:curved DNA-binding protein CbpA
VSETTFVDHYETLQLSAGADGDTIERVYRLLAKRFHPDNQVSGDPDQFNEVHRAYETLSDPERRAKYDVTYDEEKGHQWRIFDQGSAADGPEQDRRIFHGVLSLLYVARRREPEHGGLGAVHLERMLGVPREHLEFPLWYLRQRGWTETLSGGKLAITVAGIDVLGNNELSLPRDRLLTASSATTDDSTGRLSGDSHTNHDVHHTEGSPVAWSSSRPA